MYLSIETDRNRAWMSSPNVVDSGRLAVSRLSRGDEAEVLGYLSRRPAHTFALAGFIRDNGLTSPLNRGSFYVCRDMKGRIEGVALIGHAILFETTNDSAIEVFARLALSSGDSFMALAEREKIDRFCHHYSQTGPPPSLICRELLFERRRPVVPAEKVPGLRKAALDDLDPVVEAHAQLGLEERGASPLEKDAEGFRQRCRQRIERGRTWVWTDRDSLIFKADVISATPDVNYLEGVWVAPAERSKGYGLRCLAQLSQTLLKQTRSVCLLVDEDGLAARQFYLKAGYEPVDFYETVYL